MLSTRICSSAAPLVWRMSRFVGSSTRPTARWALGSAFPDDVETGSGEPPQALSTSAPTARRPMAARRTDRRAVRDVDTECPLGGCGPLGSAGEAGGAVQCFGGEGGQAGRIRLLHVVTCIDGEDSGGRHPS